MNKTRGLVKHIFSLIVMSLFVFVFIGTFDQRGPVVNAYTTPEVDILEFDGDYDWEVTLDVQTSSTLYITYSDYRDTYCKWDDTAYTPSACASAANGKYIRFDTAEELYRFSVDVSHEDIYITGDTNEDKKLSDAKIAVLLSLDYKLGNDIDYSVMESKAFIPVGYAFQDVALNTYERSFTGTFDGQGFVIDKLYLAGYDFVIHEDVEDEEPIDIAVSEYYSMFNYNEGVIKNFGLTNANLEINNYHTDITKLANIVGFNMTDSETGTDVSFSGSTLASTSVDLSRFESGDLLRINGSTSNDGVYTVTGTPGANSLTVEETFTNESAGASIDVQLPGVVENVYVIDSRSSVTEAGIRYNVGTAAQTFQAAGIVHTNQGVFRSAYYSSLIVVNGYYINKFNTQPLVYVNQGSTSNLVYDTDVYEYPTVTVNYQTFTISTPNAYSTGETTNLLKSNSSSLSGLTHVEDSVTKNIWYFYADDGYPLLKGFEYSSGNYLIYDAIDFKFFSDVQAFSTINYDTNSTTYKDSDYILMNSIDMSTIAEDAYLIPSGTFTGSLSGENVAGTDLSDNYYIYNLTISEGIIRGEDYYAGIFSVLGAGSEVSNLNFSQSTISFSNTDDYYSKDFYMGAIAGQMTGGTITNVLLDVDLDLGTEAIGKTYLGSLVGKASGSISNISNYGSLTGNTHTYSSSYIVEPIINIGGIVGAAETYQLTIDDVVNNGTISGFSTSSEFNLELGVTNIQINLGGVIGYILNATDNEHVITDISNKGNITINHVTDTYETAYQYVGGVIGHFEGVAPILEETSTYKFANLYNEGVISFAYNSSGGDVLAAGILVNNATEAIEYALLFNHAGYSFTTTGASYTQTQFKYAALVNDVSSSNVTISRAYNYADFSYDSNVYDEISPLYNSENNNTTLLRYVTNYGDINYLNNSGNTTITLASDLYITGITLESNVNYSNVYTYGEINVVGVNVGAHDLFVAGFAKELAVDHYLKKSLTDSDIVVAQISGSGNIYIAGFININYAGDLHTGDNATSAQPVATEGLFDVLNSGNISTSYGLEAAGLHGIDGTSNTFIGGIVTLNKGSIQDAGNLGDIKGYNSNASSSFSYETSTTYAGLVISYNSGIAAGGICAVVVGGDSRIYDSSNNGDVLVSANKYVRAGGVLGVSLYDEADGGGITSSEGLVNTIEDSVLSNGMNFGNISALSDTIASYSTNNYSLYNALVSVSRSGDESYMYIYVNDGNEARPPIYSSAGGVIGYGLSVMKNMLNHGTISATDVAGGVVGATYVLGSSTTYVNITTAINYGDIKAVDNSDVSSINKYSMNLTSIESYYMADGNSFIFPANYTVLSPLNKRGFGGIFGRLQRGTSGIMTSEGTGNAFDFIVNANPNVDLVGRLDQVDRFSSSSQYYRFNDAIYYSAKDNDTTQVVFTGFYVTWSTLSNRTTNATAGYDYTVTPTNLYKQVGVVTTDEGAFTDVHTLWTGNKDYENDVRYVYYAPVQAPWITEDPNDPNITDIDNEYMYDPDFPMRTNPDLTDYIYYMENELLADRFDTARPNGMYVLSTTAGEEFGLVLPRNIDIEDIRPIDEDYVGQISLLIDYENVSSTYTKNFSTIIENAFDDLKQTKFNDKAELIADDISTLVLSEVGGSNNVLTNVTADLENKELTFSIALAAFESTQTTASFAVTSASVSSGALVAKRPYDQYSGVPTTLQLQAYRALLYPEKDDGISTSYPADLTVTIPASASTVSVGYFSVFAEAFLGADLYAKDAYYTDYQVYIQFLEPQPGTNELETVSFDGGTIQTVTSPTNEVYDVRSLGTVSSLGTIKLNFEDSTQILSQGYDFKDNFVVYYSGTVVDSSNYTVTTTPVDITGGVGYYDITFDFIGATVGGDYYFEFSYFPTSTTYTIHFDLAQSNLSEIIGFEYYSDRDSVSIVGNTITSYINIGYPITDTMDDQTNNYSSSSVVGALNYESDTTYDIDFMIAGTLIISPFASVTEARLTGTTITNGYKTYSIQYTITSELGGTTVYTHSLIERTVDVESVLKDGNNVVLSDIHASREANNTQFIIDLGFDQSLNLYIIDPGSYSYIDIAVTATDHDLVAYQPSEIVGITYSVNAYLYIDMSYDTLPGIYTFTFTYIRDGNTANYVTFATSLVITKDLGTDAYLTDIEFSEIPSETSYPDMYVTDQYGVLKEPVVYDPVVYFGGIDYDDSKGIESYYQIDGYVSSLPLYDYTPLFLDYLPYGATISRYAYDHDLTTWYWTTEVDANSSAEDKATLSTDFTVDPETGAEPIDDSLVKIEYRVTAEDGQTMVYYYITVVDVEYNLSLVFDIYYCTGPGDETCTLASDSLDFDDELVILTVKNLDTDGDDTASSEENPANFPSFTTVNGLNNNSTQFFYTSNAEYFYKFGRNRSGFYTFDVELKLDQYLNDIYTYEIKYGDYYLNDASDEVAGLSGKYFYIGGSVTMRTRFFSVYIRDVSSPSTDAPFGLFDFFKSWFY